MRYARKPSSFPVGATWEFTAPTDCGFVGGSIGRVWLQEISDNGHEIWKWNWCYKDGSGSSGDWANNRQSCVDECSVKFAGKCKVRFKRVKEDSP